MPSAEGFDDIRKRLWDEIVGLHDAREQYLTLFGHSSDRVEMLNTCAGWFFGLLQKVLLREIILGISRLTDPESVAGRTNLVLASLLSDPALVPRPDVATELASAISDAKSAAEPIRLHRHKYIAHLDHAVAVQPSDELLPRLTKEQVDQAIAKIEAVYNLHGTRIRDSFASFSVGTTRGAPALVEALETSERWKTFQDLQRRKEAGEF
jgi:hypothetical protein